jgi:hypothetical protein
LVVLSAQAGMVLWHVILKGQLVRQNESLRKDTCALLVSYTLAKRLRCPDFDQPHHPSPPTSHDCALCLTKRKLSDSSGHGLRG